ncbi:amino acid transporter, partial [Acinetobacter pittii]|nr:amino acid transporter [Acinetobacter pittii]
KLSPELHAKSTFKMPGGVLMAYVVIAFFLFTLVILALEPDTLKAVYVSPLWLVVLGVSYHVFYKPRMKKLGQETFD